MSSTARERLAELRLPGTVWLGAKPVERVRRVATGIEDLDRLLGGGMPRGRLSEVEGTASSGRTALLWSLLVQVTRGGEVGAVIDVGDTLYPASLRDAGVDLDRVLWVRPPDLRTGLQCAELVLVTGGFGVVVLDIEAVPARRLPLHVWPRLARSARRSQTALVALCAEGATGSFASLRLRMSAARLRREGKSRKAKVKRQKVGTSTIRHPQSAIRNWPVEARCLKGGEGSALPCASLVFTFPTFL